MKRFLFLIAMLSLSQVYGQKLPNVQQESLRISATAKIDGVDSEWGTLQAYNKNVDVFYSLANDNENLHLIVKATDKNIIYKIINGGISLTLYPSTTKQPSERKMITYPKFERTNFPSVNLDNTPIGKNDLKATPMQIDSFSKAISKNLNDRAKMLDITSGTSDSDSLISIYNDLGIKVAQRFDSNLAYVCEMSIPLKYFTTSASSKIAYNIKLNGMYAALPKGVVITESVGGNALLGAMNPTDFWGEYTLAK